MAKSMYRDHLLDLLDDYARRHTAEQDCARQIGDFVRGRKDCFLRSCKKGHVTGSAWVVSSDGSSSLLLHHRKLGKWLQPGGHVDGEPEVYRSVLREVQEETGLWDLRFEVDPAGGIRPFDLDIHTIPAIDGEPRHNHYDIRFLLVAADGQALSPNDESLDLRWCTWDEIEGLTREESVLRMARKARSLLHGV